MCVVDALRMYVCESVCVWVVLFAKRCFVSGCVCVCVTVVTFAMCGSIS